MEDGSACKIVMVSHTAVEGVVVVDMSEESGGDEVSDDIAHSPTDTHPAVSKDECL